MQKPPSPPPPPHCCSPLTPSPIIPCQIHACHFPDPTSSCFSFIWGGFVCPSPFSNSFSSAPSCSSSSSPATPPSVASALILIPPHLLQSSPKYQVVLLVHNTPPKVTRWSTLDFRILSFAFTGSKDKQGTRVARLDAKPPSTTEAGFSSLSSLLGGRD